MTSNCVYLGVVLVIAIVIIAHFAWRYRKTRRGTTIFSYCAPATPPLREAAAGLFAALKSMIALCRSFETQAAGLADATGAHVAGARQSAAALAKTLDWVESRLSEAPPTYANYLAIYRGLSSTDGALLAAADAYVEAGRTVSGAHVADADVASLGNTLIAMGRQLRRVVSAIHRLGVDLDLE